MINVQIRKLETFRVGNVLGKVAFFICFVYLGLCFLVAKGVLDEIVEDSSERNSCGITPSQLSIGSVSAYI